MSSPPTARDAEVPRLQRLMENIWFLLAIGVVLPTLSYTVWSIVELVELPTFEMAQVHDVAHDGSDAALADAAAEAETAAAAPSGPVVRMRNMAYEPKELTIEAGTTVTWVNDDAFAHAVAHGTPDTPESERLFEGSGDFGSGESFAVTFDEPGTYEIYCSTPGHYQAGMTMTIVVQEPS